jgi:hypothetical protein
MTDDGSQPVGDAQDGIQIDIGGHSGILEDEHKVFCCQIATCARGKWGADGTVFGDTNDTAST